jgi:hypothetical protein
MSQPYLLSSRVAFALTHLVGPRDTPNRKVRVGYLIGRYLDTVGVLAHFDGLCIPPYEYLQMGIFSLY